MKNSTKIKGNKENKENNKNYDCIICFQMCQKPISCIRCHQLICKQHNKLLGNKCPHCRLQPFQYQAEDMIESFIQIQIRKKREQMKKTDIFKCLVQGCGFSGKYPAMVFHRKAKHINQKIDQILFQEDRQKRKMRQALQRLFLQRYVDKAKKYRQQAIKIYVRFRGQADLKILIKMISHIDNCQNPKCKAVLLKNNAVFVGVGVQNNDQIQESNCLQAKGLTVQI